MKKKIFVLFIFVLLAVFSFNLQMVGAAGNWATATSEISATVIELDQELSYNSVVEFDPVYASRASDGAYIIENAGNIDLTSNIPWQLNAEAANLPVGAEVYLRSTYATADKWVLLNNAAVFNGQPARGANISWDIKVVAADGSRSSLEPFNVDFDLGW
jgi:hypothetical protein